MNAMHKIEASSIRGDMGEAVRATAMLADVTLAVWSGERSDAALMERVKQDAGATGNVGRTIKNLLAGADGPLKECKAAFANVRALHYGLTLPWVSDPHSSRQTGPRLLPNLLFERYLTDLSKQKRVAEAALERFIDDYPGAVDRAKINLGTLADAAYPDASELRVLFRVNFDFQPIPAGAAFRGLPDHMLEKLSAKLHAQQDRMISTASAAMWTEVRDRVGKLAGRLSDKDALFKASTVENVRELVVLLPGWNVGDDPRIAELVKDIDDMLSGIDASDMRKDALIRGHVAQAGQLIADKLTQWGL